MRQAGHVTRMRDRRISYRILVGGKLGRETT